MNYKIILSFLFCKLLVAQPVVLNKTIIGIPSSSIVSSIKRIDSTNFAAVGGASFKLFFIKFNEEGTSLFNEYKVDYSTGSDFVKMDEGFLIASDDTWSSNILRINENGDSLWSKRMSLSMIYKIVKSHDDNLFLIGSEHPNYPFWRLRILKIDKQGEVIWDKKYGEIYSEGDVPNCIITSTNSLLLAVRESLNTMVLYNLDFNGNIIYKTNLGENKGTYSSYLVEGKKSFYWTGFPSLIKIKMDGVVSNEYYFGDNYTDENGVFIKIWDENNILVASNAYDNNFYKIVLNIDSSGVSRWKQIIKTNYKSQIMLLDQSEDNHLLYLGTELYRQIFILKTSLKLSEEDSTESNSISSLRLSNNYPNPFNDKTILTYELDEDRFISIKVYDIIGNVISVLENNYKSTGKYEVAFNASNITSGIYFIRLKSGKDEITKKVLLLH